MLGMGALLLAFVYHFTLAEGLLANTRATEAIQRAHAGDFIHRLSEGQARQLHGSGALFVDARFSRDYQVGHIEGAINIPIDANDARRHEAMSDVPRDSAIVVYCQSSYCKFAEATAVRLMDDGFHNVSILRKGWNAWATTQTFD